MNNKSTEMDRASEPEVIIREITMSASEPAAPYDEYTLNVCTVVLVAPPRRAFSDAAYVRLFEARRTVLPIRVGSISIISTF